MHTEWIVKLFVEFDACSAALSCEQTMTCYSKGGNLYLCEAESIGPALFISRTLLWQNRAGLYMSGRRIMFDPYVGVMVSSLFVCGEVRQPG